MKRIFVGIPSGTGFPYPDVIINILQQELPKGYELVFYNDNIVSGRPIHIARNLLVYKFLQSKCDYLWFVDDDNPPSIDVLKYLISCKADVASALVPLRHGGYTLNVTVDGDGLKSIEKYNGKPFEIENFGTGCVLMTREVVKAVCDITGGEPYHFTREEYVYNEVTKEKELYTHQDLHIQGWQNIYSKNYFDIKKTYVDWSEDLYFGNLAKELGFKFYAHPKARCRHYKQDKEFISVRNE